MFVDGIGPEEKRALLEALVYIASVDGELTSEEVSLIDVMATVLGIDPSTVLSGGDKPLEQILAPVSDPRHQRAVLVELLRMAFVDQRFTEEEIEAVEKVATIFGVGEATLQALREWVEEEIACRERAERLIESG